MIEFVNHSSICGILVFSVYYFDSFSCLLKSECLKHIKTELKTENKYRAKSPCKRNAFTKATTTEQKKNLKPVLRKIKFKQFCTFLKYRILYCKPSENWIIFGYSHIIIFSSSFLVLKYLSMYYSKVDFIRCFL